MRVLAEAEVEKYDIIGYGIDELYDHVEYIGIITVVKTMEMADNLSFEEIERNIRWKIIANKYDKVKKIKSWVKLLT